MPEPECGFWAVLTQMLWAAVVQEAVPSLADAGKEAVCAHGVLVGPFSSGPCEAEASGILLKFEV